MGRPRYKEGSLTESKWSLSDSAVNLKFADKPQKREHSDVFVFTYTFTDPQTSKYRHSRISTGETERRAAERRRDELKEIVLKKLSLTEIRNTDKQSIWQFFQSFLEAKEQEGKSKKTLYDYKLRLHHLAAYFAFNLPLCELNQAHLRGYFSKIPSDSTRKLSFRIIRSALNWGVLEGVLIGNPIDKIKLAKQIVRKREFLNEEEFAKLYERMPEATYAERATKAAALIAFETGVRLGEICHLKQSAIRWANRQIFIMINEDFHTKNREERTVPITQRVEDAIKMQLKNKNIQLKEEVRESSYLFCNEVGKPYTDHTDKSCKLSEIFKNTCRDVFADRKGLHFHSLRHSYGQNAFNAGVPLVEISKMMGHKNVAITAQYYAKSSDYSDNTQIHNYMFNKPSLSPIEGTLTVEELECVPLDMII